MSSCTPYCNTTSPETFMIPHGRKLCLNFYLALVSDDHHHHVLTRKISNPWAELFIVAMLGFVSHFRFRKLLENSRESTNAKSIMHKIRYFQVNVKPVLFISFWDSSWYHDRNWTWSLPWCSWLMHYHLSFSVLMVLQAESISTCTSLQLTLWFAIVSHQDDAVCRYTKCSFF